MRGIYKITNKLNERVYVGESLNVERRWDEHLNSLNCNKHHSYKLQNDYNKYGADNFEFEIVETLSDYVPNLMDKYSLLVLEHMYIQKYDSINTGYNLEDSFTLVLSNKKRVLNGKDNKMLQIVYNNMKDNNWKYISAKEAENTLIKCIQNDKEVILSIPKAIRKFRKFMLYTADDGKRREYTPLGLYRAVSKDNKFLNSDNNEDEIFVCFA